MIGTEPNRVDSSDRTTRAWWRAVALLAAGVLLVAACASDDDDDVASDDGDTTTEPTDDTADDETDADDPLGPEDPASGEPVKVGIISPGSTPSLDNQIEVDVAEAAVEWINTHHGGIAGRPIELVVCIDEGDPAKAEQCADEMVQEDVVVVLTGSHPQIETVYQRLDESDMPQIAYGAGGTIVDDTDNAFVLQSASFSSVGLPLGTAQEVGAERVLGVIIDVPAALDGWGDETVQAYADEGIQLDVLPVPIGTADMTLVLQPELGDDVGLVHVLGNDSFCIPAFNALDQLGYEGDISAISQCFSDATREQVSGDVLEGIRVGAVAPVGTDNESTRLYEAVIDAFATAEIDTTRTTGYSMFSVIGALDTATEGLDGDVTQDSIVEAISTMEPAELRGAGGLRFQCGGSADEDDPAVCTPGGLVTVLDSSGEPSAYEVVGNELE